MSRWRTPRQDASISCACLQKSPQPRRPWRGPSASMWTSIAGTGVIISMGLQEDGEFEAALRLQKGQQALTPEQEAEARRFAEERIRAQLDTAPVDEDQAEGFLWQAYAAAELPP